MISALLDHHHSPFDVWRARQHFHDSGQADHDENSLEKKRERQRAGIAEHLTDPGGKCGQHQLVVFCPAIRRVVESRQK